VRTFTVILDGGKKELGLLVNEFQQGRKVLGFENEGAIRISTSIYQNLIDDS
jgi:hypothetical protein